MKLLANKVYIQGMHDYYWLTKCINKNHNVNGYASHKHEFLNYNKQAFCILFVQTFHQCMYKKQLHTHSHTSNQNI